MGRRTNTAQWIESRQRWQINVQKEGERRTFTSSKPGRAGQREANAKADAWLDNGIDVKSNRVSDLIPAYLEDVKTRTSKSNFTGEESRCRIWIAPIIGHIRASNLTDQHLQNVINAAFAKGLSKKSLKSLRSTMMAFIKFCRKNKKTSYHPEEVIIPNSASTGTRSILQPEHLVILFTIDTTVLRGQRVYDDLINAYRLQVLLGLRPGELLGLMRNDRRGNALLIGRSINIYGEITTGKNANANRVIPLGNLAAQIWDDQVSKTSSPYLFEGLKEQKLYKRLKRYCQSNGIPPVSPYEMRHTFVSMIQDLPEGWIKKLVGHSKNMDTYGVYSHEVTGKQDEISQRVESIFQDILSAKEKNVY